MGQQQLLLLVLGIVIVGLAVVAGINAFSENQEKSTKDAIVNEGMRIATDVQSWKLKPAEFGGGGGSYTGGKNADNASDVMAAALGSANVDGAVYNSAWGDITLGVDSNVGTLTLAPSSGTEEATIEIPANGGSPTFGNDWGSAEAN